MLSVLRIENHETVPRRPVDDFTHFVTAVGNFVRRQRVAEPVTEFTPVEIFERKGERQFGNQRAGGGVVIQCGVPVRFPAVIRMRRPAFLASAELMVRAAPAAEAASN